MPSPFPVPKKHKCPLCRRIASSRWVSRDGVAQYGHVTRDPIQRTETDHEFDLIWDNDAGWGLPRGMASEIVRIYETRIDCWPVPGGARLPDRNQRRESTWSVI